MINESDSGEIFFVRREYWVQSHRKQAKKVQTLFITHLAFSDLLMGVNMLLLALGDVYYGEYFPSYSHGWKHRFPCKLAGFLSIVLSEGSVTPLPLLCVTTII